MYGFFKRQSPSEKVQSDSSSSVPGFILGDPRFNGDSLSTKGKLLYLTGNMGYDNISSMRSNAGQWDSQSMGTNNHDNFLGNNESSYDRKVRCQSYNRYFPKN